MLEDTGERVIPKEMKLTNGLLLEHLARYYFALPYVNQRVLDIACGTGYGAQMLAKIRKKQVTKIIGVDISESSIDYAIKNYYHPLVRFQTGDALDPTLIEKVGTFDTIVSFETIEHVPDDKEFLERLYELLKPGGHLILSTPFGQGRGKPCGAPFHYHQLTEKEFISLFDEPYFEFESVEFFYQQGVAVEKVKRSDVRYPIGIVVCKKLA